MKLTKMEIQFLNAMRNNHFSDALDEDITCEWLFAVTDELPYTEKQSTGVMSSLVQKELIHTSYDEDERQYLVGLTDLGRTLWDNAKGEKCSWGGLPLMEVPMEPVKTAEQMLQEITEELADVRARLKEYEGKTYSVDQLSRLASDKYEIAWLKGMEQALKHMRIYALKE